MIRRADSSLASSCQKEGRNYADFRSSSKEWCERSWLWPQSLRVVEIPGASAPAKPGLSMRP